MELQQGLNNVIRERIQNRIQVGGMNAQQAYSDLLKKARLRMIISHTSVRTTPVHRKYYSTQMMWLKWNWAAMVFIQSTTMQ